MSPLYRPCPSPYSCCITHVYLLDPKSSTALTATRVDISCLPPPDAELPPITDVIQDFKVDIVRFLNSLTKATAGPKPTASHLMDDSEPYEAAVLAEAPMSAVNTEGAVRSLKIANTVDESQHPLCVNSMPPSVRTTTSPEIPTSLAQEMAQVITLERLSSPKLSRDRISSTKLVTATQTIVASKTQALVDRVLRHLPAAHLILQEVNTQEIVLKKSHGTETPSSASGGIIKHVFGFIGHWIPVFVLHIQTFTNKEKIVSIPQMIKK
ncbi:hypothetical protein V8E53_007640 [Lactarius tabidus]